MAERKDRAGKNCWKYLLQILSSLISDSVKKSGIKTTVREDGSIDCGTVLIVGLGNRFVTADAIGPLAVDGITVTRHIKLSDKELFGKLGASETAAIAPGVAGQTGIETSELVKSTAKSISPSVIIAIDALAARSTERLGTTVQLCDTGISPGSGIGNFRGAINYKTLGIPVIAIGVRLLSILRRSSMMLCHKPELKIYRRNMKKFLKTAAAFLFH